MKKLLFILFLGLLLVSCSQNKKDTALENCADDGFINHKDPYFDEKYSSYVGMVVSNWGKDKIGNKRLKQSKDLHKKINSAQKKFKAGEVLPKIMTDGWEKGRQRARETKRNGKANEKLEEKEQREEKEPRDEKEPREEKAEEKEKETAQEKEKTDHEQVQGTDQQTVAMIA